MLVLYALELSPTVTASHIVNEGDKDDDDSFIPFNPVIDVIVVLVLLSFVVAVALLFYLTVIN